MGVYALLVSKRVETYTEFLTQVNLLTNNVAPQSIMVDSHHKDVYSIFQNAFSEEFKN